MNAIEAVARSVYDEGAWCGDCEYEGWDTCSVCREVCDKYARAAVAALAAQGDITDDIPTVVVDGVTNTMTVAEVMECVGANVTALLARQAAVHATEVEGFEQRLNLAHYAHQEAKARVAELEAQRDRALEAESHWLGIARRYEATVNRVRALCAMPMRAVDFMEAVPAALADGGGPDGNTTA
jgi:hypothetical protein